MVIYKCSVCDTEFNEEKEGRTFDVLCTINSKISGHTSIKLV